MLRRAVIDEIIDFNSQSTFPTSLDPGLTYHDHVVHYRTLMSSAKPMAEELRVIKATKFLGDIYNFNVRNVTEQFPLYTHFPEKDMPQVWVSES